MNTSYQIFTRSSHVGGRPTPGRRPRRYCIAHSIEEARRICASFNERRSARQIRDGFHYEFANLPWYEEAFGRSRR